MDEKHANAHEQFFAAIRALSASSDCIQMRLIRASEYIMLVTIDEFENDKELKLKFWGAARLGETAGCGNLNRNRSFENDQGREG
jgi:hypothetical protein